ncbi:hypothetical protein QUE06_00765 [Lactococcus lactis]|uniref:hypothetical protein n=1 Tax=Lactococcus lactis TaxID=1358 RepID=UPI0025A0A18B|nr:hypothetical protein [Lactococcus lactis]MDM7533494.1 hypothetical protein [Lactococcus lactis]
MEVLEKEKIINQVEEYMTEDFTWLQDGSDDTTDWLMFVAYRIKAMMLNSVYKKNQAIMTYEKQELNEDYNDFLDMLLTMEDSGIFRFDWDKINKKRDYQEIVDNINLVTNMYGYGVSVDLLNLINRFKFMQSDSEEFMALYSEYEKDMLPLLIAGLSKGLDKVDDSKTGKEKTKYINRIILTEFVRLQKERDGYILIRESGKRYYIKPELKDDMDCWKLLTKQTFKFVGIDNFESVLTRKQYQFLIEAYMIVRGHYDNKDIEWFRFDKKGNVKLNKRKLSGELGVSEVNFNQTMKRIQKRIDKIFADVFSEYLKKNR